ncbi:MAG: hypothetical protein LC808_23460, partial [Actinobacteria bacterium]|nr:hypothetical protein [Actinomycetota bacterium]
MHNIGRAVLVTITVVGYWTSKMLSTTIGRDISRRCGGTEANEPHAYAISSIGNAGQGSVQRNDTSNLAVERVALNAICIQVIPEITRSIAATVEDAARVRAPRDIDGVDNIDSILA